MTTVELTSKQGRIKGQELSVNVELTQKKCIHFGNIPFARCARFELPTSYGSWDGIWDGTRPTTRVPQNSTLSKNLKKCLGITAYATLEEAFNEVPVSEEILHIRDLKFLN